MASKPAESPRNEQLERAESASEVVERAEQSLELMSFEEANEEVSHMVEEAEAEGKEERTTLDASKKVLDLLAQRYGVELDLEASNDNAAIDAKADDATKKFRKELKDALKEDVPEVAPEVKPDTASVDTAHLADLQKMEQESMAEYDKLAKQVQSEAESMSETEKKAFQKALKTGDMSGLPESTPAEKMMNDTLKRLEALRSEKNVVTARLQGAEKAAPGSEIRTAAPEAAPAAAADLSTKESAPDVMEGEEEEPTPDTERVTLVPEQNPEQKKEGPEAVQESARMAEDVLKMRDGYFEGLETLAVAAAENQEKRAAILKVLKEKIGNKAAEILDSPELRKDLANLKEKLSGRWGGENGPEILPVVRLTSLVALRETIGSNPEEFLAIIDIKQRLEKDGDTSDLKYMDGNLIRVDETNVDPETGELTATVKAGFVFEGGGPGKFTQISREFTRTVEKDKDGKPRVKKSVEHSLLSLPSSLRDNGLAADITRQSLAEYDKQGIDEVKLHANIDVGGYAWAAYGYGWNKKKMAESFTWSEEGEELEVEVGGVTKKMKDLSDEERAEVAESNAEAYANEAVLKVIKLGRQKLEKAFAETGYADGGALLAELDALAENPLPVTPQTLAEFGRSGPKFFFSAETNMWFNETSLAEAVQSGGVTPEEADDLKKIPFHAGKIALQNSSWFGKIDLKPDGEQGGKNRKLLETYLSKPPKKQS